MRLCRKPRLRLLLTCRMQPAFMHLASFLLLWARIEFVARFYLGIPHNQRMTRMEAKKATESWLETRKGKTLFPHLKILVLGKPESSAASTGSTPSIGKSVLKPHLPLGAVQTLGPRTAFALPPAACVGMTSCSGRCGILSYASCLVWAASYIRGCQRCDLSIF